MSQTGFLTVAEIAAELRVHPVTVQKLCREGALQSYQVGRSYRIPRSKLRGRTKADDDAPPSLDPELSALVTTWLQDKEGRRAGPGRTALYLASGVLSCSGEGTETSRIALSSLARFLWLQSIDS